MTENLEVFDFDLTEGEMEELATLEGRGEPVGTPTGSATEVGEGQ
jgi:diketogulonate reductase-like aldo/keto reductase